MRSAEPVRWGIVGPGTIARRFARDLAALPDGRIVAVASRSAARARAFAAEHAPGARAHEGVAALAADPEVDAAYVATPHPRHAADAVALLEAGKHVLCEKPLATSEAEVRRMAAAARAHDRFLMEAMWTRFLPTTERFLELAREAAGDAPANLQVDFTVHLPAPPEHRLRAPESGGGALLDLGVYPLSLAQALLGEPDEVVSVWRPDPVTGVDAAAAIALRVGARQALVRIGFDGHGRREAVWTTPRGRVALGPAWSTDAARVRTEAPPDDAPDALATATDPVTNERPGFAYEIEEVHARLRAGARESPRWPLAASLAVARTSDALRRAWGLAYPFEAPDAPGG